MTLHIETFSNASGGNCTFKAFGHPLVIALGRALVAEMTHGRAVAVYDPFGLANVFGLFYDLRGLQLVEVFVQRIEDLEGLILGRKPRPVMELAACRVDTVFVAAFDAEQVINHIRHLLPPGVVVKSLDAMRLPVRMLTNPRHYLDPLNFATNLALLRDGQGRHTRLTTCNYWHGWGASEASLWFCLFDEQGKVLAQWEQQLPAGAASVVVDSAEVRQRFATGDFTGSLFVHAFNIAGHDVVKYALDTYGDEPHELSCTHDANAWPADRYAGLPAPGQDETVVLWLQNSHPIPIPAGSIGINPVGSSDIKWLDTEIPPYGTHALDVANHLPDVRWPQQLEVQAGRHIVRPRYETTTRRGRSRIAHLNVERCDLKLDPMLARIGDVVGKGYLVPAPLMPLGQWRSTILPTFMATCQTELPVAVRVFDADGSEAAIYRFGRLARADSVALDVSELIAAQQAQLPSGYGHMELVYDFGASTAADGWLHALFRYEHLASGHVAETSFGAHMFNMPVTYRNEPQSYVAKPPGLSTRLFLRIGGEATETFCHLTYPVSSTWHANSSTELILCDSRGTEVARRALAIARGGSLLWRYSEMFSFPDRQRAGGGAYVLVRDSTCRLFGYHGLARGEYAFSLDHMFGF